MQTRPERRRKRLSNVLLSYKEPDSLRPFINEYGRIRPQRQTGLSPSAQRRLAREVKRARHLALLPFVAE